MFDVKLIRPTLFSFYRDIVKAFFIFFMIGALLILVCGYWYDGLLWLIDFLVSFAASFILLFRKREVRSEFKGDR